MNRKAAWVATRTVAILAVAGGVYFGVLLVLDALLDEPASTVASVGVILLCMWGLVYWSFRTTNGEGAK